MISHLGLIRTFLNYTYATEASGYFVELSLHSHWQVNEQLTLTPYVTQGFDFGYASQTHDGPNHLQFGVEACYSLVSCDKITNWQYRNIENINCS